MTSKRTDQLTWRHWTLAGLVLLSILAVMVRLYQVQILNHEGYLEQAAATRQGAATLPAPRGAILDKTGYPLATSVDTWDVYIDRFLWRDREKALRSASGLADFLGMSPGDLFDAGTEYDTGDSLVVRQLDYERGLVLDDLDLWGVRLLPSSKRIYPEGDLAGSLVGYVGRDGVGLWGIESDFDSTLEGHDGWTTMERDALGRPIAFSRQNYKEPISGGEVQLTIDRFIQAIVEDALKTALEKYNARSGSIIVMDPHTGEVLAMASSPSVDLDHVDLNDPNLDQLVKNHAVTDLYEPGSVLKTLTTATAIDLGLVGPESTYDDTGAVEYGGYTIRNWDLSAHGLTTVREYLQASLNTGSVWLADMVGPDDFYKYLAKFGLGEQTHVGLSGEGEGTYRTPASPDWYPVDLATNSYGQGLAVTPLQMLTAVNTFANGGVLMRPYIVSKVVTPTDVRTYEPVEVRRVVTEETARTVYDLMHDVVEGQPWGHGAQVPGYEVAGKTGTTLVSIPTGYDIDSTIASFAGFIPYNDPKISVLVKIDQPSGGLNLGGQVAAPVFSDLAAKIMDYLRVPPSDPLVSQP
ncbi:MAG: penicillin-binding protein 2 [Dehalococcoidia bacterium]|nr:penicillin-binding protein 2 [Dehalococcoidia bacterium]MCB9491743.1 penicillin-binding protein 2 [Dehalococcoidia bacterium]